MSYVTIGRRFEISCAHFLPDHPKCGVLHGHNYKIDVLLYGVVPSKTGLLMDFSDLKKQVQSIISERFDHRVLNSAVIKEGCVLGVPTVENMAICFFNLLKEELTLPALCSLLAVRIWETDDCWAEVGI